MSELLTVEQATARFNVPGGEILALNKVSLTIRPGETVGVVGESGCGKTTLARAVLGLQPLVSGAIKLNGKPVQGVRPNQAQELGMVWQDPFASLNPRWKVGKSALEPANLCGVKVDLANLFREVGLSPELADRYPHELSGGQRQRVAIARSIALRPPLVICDEPTAALDLSARAQILNLLKDIQTQTGCSFLYISHDLTTVRHLADRVAVMYLGEVVEENETENLFQNPRHPYTYSLLDSAPTLDRIGHLPEPLEGEIPDPRTRFPGCNFASRCPRAQSDCQTNHPVFSEQDRVACWHPLEFSATRADFQTS